MSGCCDETPGIRLIRGCTSSAGVTSNFLLCVLPFGFLCFFFTSFSLPSALSLRTSSDPSRFPNMGDSLSAAHLLTWSEEAGNHIFHLGNEIGPFQPTTPSFFMVMSSELARQKSFKPHLPLLTFSMYFSSDKPFRPHSIATEEPNNNHLIRIGTGIHPSSVDSMSPTKPHPSSLSPHVR